MGSCCSTSIRPHDIGLEFLEFPMEPYRVSHRMQSFRPGFAPTDDNRQLWYKSAQISDLRSSCHPMFIIGRSMKRLLLVHEQLLKSLRRESYFHSQEPAYRDSVKTYATTIEEQTKTLNTVFEALWSDAVQMEGQQREDLEFRLVVLNDDMKIAFKKVADQIASKEKIANIDDCTTEAQRINAELDAITDYDPPIAFPHREVTASRIAVGLRLQDDDDA